MNELDGLKIIIAEDEPFMRQVLENVLKKEGAWVASCCDGREALAMARSPVVIDVVLLDFMMPYAHGLYVLKKIRSGQSGLHHDIPVGLLTGAKDQRTLARSVLLDCDAFIIKPINKADLVERVGRLRRRSSRTLRPAAYYATIDVGFPDNIESIPDVPEPVSSQPAAPVRADRAPEPVLRIAAAALIDGMVLAEDLRTEQGDIVVPVGTTMHEGVLHLLRDLSAIRSLCPVAVHA